MALVQVKTFEAASRLVLEAQVNAFLATLAPIDALDLRIIYFRQTGTTLTWFGYVTYFIP